jgi:hypothetical protein
MVIEAARFRPNDPDPLVRASFACSLCLREPSAATVDHGPDGATVLCRCAGCETTWTVALDLEQELRLELRPPWRGMSTVLRHH